MSEKGNRHAIYALKDRRFTMAGEIVQMDALRRAEKPLASSDVTDAIVEAKGYRRDSIDALTQRVRIITHTDKRGANENSGESIRKSARKTD
jgi:hypothetical protein